MSTTATQQGRWEPLRPLKTSLRLSRLKGWWGSFHAKLFAGFAGVALLTLFATGFALYLFNKFAEVVNATAGEAIPELMAVMRLSESSALLVAVAPVLAAASGEADLREAEAHVNTLVDEFNLDSEHLSSAHRGGAFDGIRTNSESLLATLADLKKATLRRLWLGQHRLSGLAELRKVQGDLTDILNPVLYSATSLSNLLARRGGRKNAAALKNLIEVDSVGLMALMETQSALQTIAGLLEISRSGSSTAAPEQWRENCDAAKDSMPVSLARLGTLGNGSELIAEGLKAAELLRCDLPSLEMRSAEGEALAGQVEMLIDDFDVAIARHREQFWTNYTETVQQVRSTPQILANETLRDFRYALELKAEANLLIGLLTTVTYADDKHTVTNLYNRYRGSLVALGNAVTEFEGSEVAERNPFLAGQVVQLERRLAEFAEGDESPFRIRLYELEVAERIQTLLATHREQASLLTRDASRLVEAVQADTSALRSNMASTHVTAVSILIAVWFGSLVIATLIAYLTTQLISRHESDLRDAKNTAELINQELEAFNYSVSHDLRAPLRTLSGFSQALLEDYRDKLDGEGKNYLNYLQEGSREMGELIDGLLKLSRSTRGDVNLEEVDLSGMARSIAARLSNADPDRQVTFQVAPGLLARADPRLIRVVLDNIFSNAWKYTAKKQYAQIVFGATKKDGEIIYSLRDNGAGFDMAYVKQLFQPFQRLHRVEEFDGTGIGLATVQRIIRRHGGTIWAQASPDKGATFFFTLRASNTPS